MTLLPLSWLLAVTSTAAWQKMFAADPHLGFLAHASQTSAAVAYGTVNAATGARLIFNDRSDALLCGVLPGDHLGGRGDVGAGVDQRLSTRCSAAR